MHLSRYVVLKGEPCPNADTQRREPTHEWLQIRSHLKDTTQIKYELIRPVILFGVSAKERAAETGEPRSSIHYQANLFDVSGIASLLPPEPPPPVPKLDKRILPPPMRQAIVDLHTEYPQHHVDEIARIMYIQFGRRPSAQTIKLTLAWVPMRISSPASMACKWTKLRRICRSIDWIKAGPPLSRRLPARERLSSCLISAGVSWLRRTFVSFAI